MTSTVPGTVPLGTAKVIVLLPRTVNVAVVFPTGSTPKLKDGVVNSVAVRVTKLVAELAPVITATVPGVVPVGKAIVDVTIPENGDVPEYGSDIVTKELKALDVVDTLPGFVLVGVKTSTNEGDPLAPGTVDVIGAVRALVPVYGRVRVSKPASTTDT